MDTKIRKQRIQFFIQNMIVFGLIFLLLGGIIFQLMGRSVYKEVDNELTKVSSNQKLIMDEINRYLNSSVTQDKPFFDRPKMDFQVQLILLSKDGEILNKQALGNRLQEYQDLSIFSNQLNRIQHQTLSGGSNGQLYFRTLTISVSNFAGNEEVAYVQFIANTNQIHDTIMEFQMIVVLCLLLFFILAIGVSVYLSRKTMQPIYQAWKKQQDFVENASHELRTPLTIIQSKLETTLTKPYHTILEESENIALSLAEITRLDHLTRDLLLLARSDTKELTLNYSQVELTSFITEVCSPYEELATIEEKDFILESDTEKGRTTFFDQEKIHQVLVILMDNALKYTNKGNQIRVTSSMENKKWKVQVLDTGVGIAEENQAAIFERFFREDQARQRETGGYGLGLSIAKDIVALHEGTIEVRDNFPSGAIFTLFLPLKENN